ncbi:MAG: hypothetical protein IJJ13_02765 [Lachnospiraceae bacterium]|nr:hypothetical protein [Lachnospiraceae bacterium]
MDSNLKRAEEILDTHITMFLEQIDFLSEISAHKSIRKQIPNFQVLGPGNEEFYQYAYYERTLESIIRELLVNPVLSDLFQLYGISAFWPDREGRIYVNASNESIEDKYFCQFSIKKNGKEIGYRYSPVDLYEDETLHDLLNAAGLDQVVELDWKKVISKRNQNEDLEIRHISIKQFFDEIFSVELYPLFLSKTQQAVALANDIIGFQTIPRLSLRYLSSFKIDVSHQLASNNYTEFRYQVLKQNKHEAEKYSRRSFSEADYESLNRNFFKRKSALVGDRDFAKSFITAEYLYQIIKSGNNLDYTSVVSGYFKAVEQLTYTIMCANLPRAKETDDFWISGRYKGNNKSMSRNNPKTNSPQVKFVRQNKKFFDITLVPLLWCLYDNKFYFLSDSGTETAHVLLKRFAKECRNDHSHKDNIESFEDVECIRHDAHLVLYILLGGCRMTDSDESDFETLGIIDSSFVLIYRRLIELPRSVAKFKIQFGSEQPMYVRRLHVQDKPVYQKNGSITSTIKFVKEENYSEECETSGFADIILSANNIPSRIWLIKRDGEEVEIDW